MTKNAVLMITGILFMGSPAFAAKPLTKANAIKLAANEEVDCGEVVDTCYKKNSAKGKPGHKLNFEAFKKCVTKKNCEMPQSDDDHGEEQEERSGSQQPDAAG
jgi:hypothetical protein